MKIDSIDGSGNNVTVRVVYKVFFESDFKESVAALASLGIESGISGFLEKGNSSESLLLTLDGFPLDIGRFIISLNSSLPLHINITDLSILGKKVLTDFKSYTFYSNFPEAKKEKQILASDFELSDEEIEYSENILKELFSGKIVNIKVQDSKNSKGEMGYFVCAECNINKFKDEIGDSDFITMYFQDIEHILKYCKFSAELVKLVTNEGIAGNVELKKNVLEKLSLLNYDGAIKLYAAVPESAFFKKIIADVNSRKDIVPILFELEKLK